MSGHVVHERDLVGARNATAPQGTSGSPPAARTVRHADQPTLPASGDREFRYFVTDEIGEGEGVLHGGGADKPVPAGSCIHLPPFFVHSLENSGDAPVRIVAVFHPADDPASRAYEANE